ncbi:MAG: hypothetical protein GX639_02730 [Fibrobacter sp.]|mgnify:CR=1 FL=1|nr:hypothetical protein [Fibrobacter sp.]
MIIKQEDGAMGKFRYSLLVAAIAGLFSVTGAATIFQEDFSSPGDAHNAWTASNDFITRTFNTGACVVTNASDQYTGYVYHVYTAKPAVFTVSAKISRTAETALAGFSLGFNPLDYSGLTVMVGNDAVYFGRSSEGTLNGVASPYIDKNNNVLKVSMNGSTCNIFVNDKFVTTFNYSSIAAGDFGFILSKQTTVTYDDVLVTDEFTDKPAPVKDYVDEFDGALKADWTVYKGNGTAAAQNGKLSMVSDNTADAYVNMLVNIELDSFVLKTVVSHRSGSASSVYGILLEGDEDTAQSTFAITAGKYYGAVAGRHAFNLTKATKINGLAYTEGGQTYYYNDMLEVVKYSGVNTYAFVVNGDTLTRLSGLNYPITKAGLFCQDSLNLEFESFTINSLPVTSIKHFVNKRSVPVMAMLKNYAIIDPLGRVIPTSKVLDKKSATGVYIIRTNRGAQTMLR